MWNTIERRKKCARGKKTPTARGRPSNIVMCVCARLLLLRHGRGYRPREIERRRERVLLERRHRDVGH